MKGSLPVKIGRVVANLALNPRYLPRTLRHTVINGASPLDLELPWFSYAAIDFLADELTPEMEVCEYGSGGSELFFGGRTHRVFSVEENPKWVPVVSRRGEQIVFD